MTEITSFLIGGTQSGSGKTTISLGVMSAMMNRGFKVQPFKCGPDFIDPTLHEMVTGKVSRNLDLRMCGEAWCKKSFNQSMQGNDVGIVEGVMGLFDGGAASAGSLAEKLSLPVVLVVDARSAAESVAAVVKGFETFNPHLVFAGVIFNQVGSDRHEKLIRESVEQNCRSPIIGFIPREISFAIAQRHLGLHMGSESPLDRNNLRKLTDTIEKHVDVDYLMTCKTHIAEQDESLKAKTRIDQKSLRMAIARDEAFCFYYQDNFDLFRKNDFELVFFSPLKDKELPYGLDMIYFGGGYPELYGAQLSMNRSMISSIRDFARKDGVIYGECGGFMYLGEQIVDQNEKVHEMVGVFPMTVKMGKRLNRLGYREAKLVYDCPLGKKNEKFYGHEFHYSEIVRIDSTVERLFILQDGSFEGYRVNNVSGGYLHIHFARNQENINHLFRYIDNIK